MKARIIDNTIVDLSSNPQRDFAPGLASQFEDVPDGVGPGWKKVKEIVDGLLTSNDTWIAPDMYLDEYEPGLFRYSERRPPKRGGPVIRLSRRVVTRRQAKQALHMAGLLNAVDNALNAIPNQEKKALMRIEWEDSITFDRDRPQLIELATAIGLNSQQLDALFETAAALP